MKRQEAHKQDDIPLHHYPVNIGLSTGMEIAPNWTLALNEFRELAAESRKRRAEKAHQHKPLEHAEQK